MAGCVAVDIGSTFTDLVHLAEETGAVGVAKASPTPGRFEDGVRSILVDRHVFDHRSAQPEQPSEYPSSKELSR